MCECIEKANEVLARHNTAIDTTLVITKSGKVESRLCVPTRRTDGKKRKSPMRVFAGFCPMCGERIPESEDTGNG